MGKTREPEAYYLLLDALRGFASLSVVTYHLSHWLDAPWLATNSNLAVDMFYCLSGFVLASAYGHRRDLSFAQFAARRLIRLLPLVAMATVISAAYVVLRYQVADPRSYVANETLPFDKLAVAIVLGAANLPYFGAPRVLGGPELFPLNGPQYTLFFEVFVNLLWWRFRRLPQVGLSLVLIALCAPLCLILGFGGANAENFASGFPRVILCFQLGVLAFHLSATRRRTAYAPAAFVAASSITMVVFYGPIAIGPVSHLLYCLVVLPAVVLFGSRLRVPGRLARPALALGAISYPVYILHYPVFMWVNGAYRMLAGKQDAALEGPVLIVVLLIGSALALWLYDRPVRSWLSSLLRGSSRAVPVRSGA